MTRGRWMAVWFALESTCFLIGPFPGYAQLVGASADVPCPPSALSGAH